LRLRKLSWMLRRIDGYPHTNSTSNSALALEKCPHEKP
jgi:hypothetical protein